MISAPSEMRCRSMPYSFIIRKVTASTSGMDSATTRPVRKPRLKKLTASTMTTASSSVLMNSSTERFTTSGWFEYWCTSMPTGRSRLMRAKAPVQVLAELHDVAALGHRHRQPDRFLPHVA